MALHLSLLPNLFDSFVSFSSFNAIHKLFTRFFDSKMSNNFTAMTHATGGSILGFSYLISRNPMLYYFLKTFSTGYFLYDMNFILKKGNFDQLNLAYLYHHFASIYIINKNPIIYKGGNILFWGELSNIPSYFVYYCIKHKDNPAIAKHIPFLKKLQFFMYAGIRLPVMGYLAVKTLMTADKPLEFAPVIPVYIMGTIWSYKMYKALKM